MVTVDDHRPGADAHVGLRRGTGVRRTRMFALLAVFAMTACACGTRLDDSQFAGGIGEVPGTAVGDADSGTGTGDGSDTTSGGDTGVDFSGIGPGTGTGGDDITGDASTGDASTSTGSTADNGSTGDTGSAATSGTTDGDATAGSATDGGSTGGSAPNEASDVGVFPDRIKVGNIVDKGGALGPNQFTPTYYGANAYFQYLNAVQGGIHGRQVEFLTCDSKETQDGSFSCAERLVEDEQVFALVANNLRNYASAGYVSDNGVPDVGGQPVGNEYWTYPTLFSILRSGYPRDGTVGFDGTLYWGTGIYHWFADNTGITKVAVFYYSIPISKEAGLRMVQSFEETGLEVLQFEINPALPNFDSAVVTMQNEGVDAIFDAMDNNANRNMCDSMQRRNFSVKVKGTTVAGWTRKVGDTFADVCRPAMYVGGSSRPMSDRAHPEVELFNDVMSRVYDGQFDATMHQWHFEGWLAAKMFAQEVEAMGPTPTRQGLIDRLNAYDRNTLDGGHVMLDWKVKDYVNDPPPMCNVIAKWSDDVGDFETVVGPDDPCLTKGGYFPYEASA